MVRRYAESITVRTAELVDAEMVGGSAGGGSPEWFEWRGRGYAVCAVLSHWRERRSWWRDVLDTSGRGGSGETPIAAAARERQVWRVEVVTGRRNRGIFELVCDLADPPEWQIRSVAD
ncbi:MAG: hypothetical protein CSA84_05800 [Actinomycetales bacterium]|nr:MAG: hypothetical protein CSA84_05800 [Actinomycetales bacterium]